MTLALLRSMSPIGSYSMKETSNADFTLFAGGFAGGFGGPVLAAAGLVVFYSSAFAAAEWDAIALLRGMLSFFATSGFLTLGVATLGAATLKSSVTTVFILVESANISDKSF